MHVWGTYVVRLQEFGVEPPRRFGGLLRVRDRVTVHFDVVPEPEGGAIGAFTVPLPSPAQTVSQAGSDS
jgi:hypothetical protein